MNLEDHLFVKVESHSSSVQSTRVTSRSSEVPQKFLKSVPRREVLKTCVDKEKKGRMLEHQLKACNKNLKNPENRKNPSSYSASRKQSRKAENPVHFTAALSDSRRPTTWICKNSACRAVLLADDTFCRRCSCCICHGFDDNKDPSLWLVCESESALGDSCGLSCHIECAFEKQKLGVVKLGLYMQLDGSYCCFSCGKVSAILGYWKKQLAIARDARRVDVLCYRVYLSYRLLNDTSRFTELHEIVAEAKAKLEAEVGPMNGESVKMARGIVSRLATAADVQKLCSNAIDKADALLAKVPSSSLGCTVASLPAACRFLFEEITSSSVLIVLIEIPMPLTDSIKGYKLWYSESKEAFFPEEPVCVFPREKSGISIKDLKPCTEYIFRIMSYTDTGDLGHSEARCFTKSAEILNDNPSVEPLKKENPTVEGTSSTVKDLAGPSSGFKVRDLNNILESAWKAQEQARLEEFCSADVKQCCDSPKDRQLPPVSRDLDLNVASVPDLNEDLTPPLESSRDEDNVLAGSNGSGPSDDSQAWAPPQNGDVPAVDSLQLTQRKRDFSAIEETLDCDSTLVNGSSFRLSDGPGPLDDNFEYCVKVIRVLECKGFIKQEFRLKLLTWFSLRSTEQERRIVHTFIRTLADDQKSLAGQLVDSFTDIISCKKLKSSFNSKS